MALSEDLIDFEVIEGQKENIQSLPGGRSAKKLAQLYSPTPLHPQATPTPSDTRDANDEARAEFEEEVANLAESDDPLDVFDRYVRWTLDSYPSTQATPQSQLHTLLERATKAFVGSVQYKNDPRYLKLWLHYIRLFSDSPRETFVFLSRHGIGESLALFYEEYAAWLESAERWAQAEEVYKLGIERDARPVARLVRKFGEFERRKDQHGEDGPASPALPSVRPALAAKTDPYVSAPRDPQAPRPNVGLGGGSAGAAGESRSTSGAKPAKVKLAIFSDAAEKEAPAMSTSGLKGWDSIGSLADRKKENTVEPRPWVGETLKTDVKKSGAAKMAIFRDPKLARIAENSKVLPANHQVNVNPSTGKRESIFVRLDLIYPTPDEPGTELSFEELWAMNQGWLDISWDQQEEESDLVVEEPPPMDPHDENDVDMQMQMLSQTVKTKLVVHSDAVPVMFDENGAIKDQQKLSKPRKKKVMEVNETQIIKAKLDSPSGPKTIRKKQQSSEPTMTLHTRAATDEIYDLFNAPLQSNSQDQNEEDSDEDEYMTDGDYTSGGESTCTTRQIELEDANGEETTDVTCKSSWSEYTASARKDFPHGDVEYEEGHDDQENDTGATHLGDEDDEYDQEEEPYEPTAGIEEGADDDELDDQPRTRTVFIPVPPHDVMAPLRPYRDPAEVANNRLPFMTPITERTESSLGGLTARKNHCLDAAKTPSRREALDTPMEDDEEMVAEDEEFEFEEPPSSPLREVLSEIRSPVKLAPAQKPPAAPAAKPAPILKGPIIKDAQCNPVDPSLRDEILEKMHPPLSSYAGFFDHRDTHCDRGPEIRRFAKSVAKSNGKSSTTKDRTSLPAPIILEFPEIEHTYALKRELGAGAFAPVYLMENSTPNSDDSSSEGGDNEPLIQMGKGAFPNPATSQATARHALEALKMEQPPTAWEFHMMRLASIRLGPHHRATSSISPVHELHLYQDEGFMVLPFHQHGTLLDLVNFFRETPSGVMDEPLAMFFAVELLRTTEALHGEGIMHGDLKVDNCLLRLDGGEEVALTSAYQADGSHGWAGRGVTLIDFGRAIDMRAFEASVRFIADWKTTGQDCAEMREGRPWTWQLDYHGLAGILHCLLFGKYIETSRCESGGLATGQGRKYKLRESLKRYWQTEIWGQAFDLLLNPGSHVEGEEGENLPVMRGLRAVRESMEGWLEQNAERGVGLRGLLGRVEGWARGRKARVL